MTAVYAEEQQAITQWRPWVALSPLLQTVVKYQFTYCDYAAWWWRFDHGQAHFAYPPGTVLPPTA